MPKGGGVTDSTNPGSLMLELASLEQPWAFRYLAGVIPIIAVLGFIFRAD
jgi:hypothetical protein